MLIKVFIDPLSDNFQLPTSFPLNWTQAAPNELHCNIPDDSSYEDWVNVLFELDKTLNYIFLSTGYAIAIQSFETNTENKDFSLYFGAQRKHGNKYNLSSLPSIGADLYEISKFTALSASQHRSLRFFCYGLKNLTKARDWNLSLMEAEEYLNQAIVLIVSALEGMYAEIKDSFTERFIEIYTHFYMVSKGKMNQGFIKEIENENDIRKFFKGLYNIRSKIAHGSFDSKSKFDSYKDLRKIMHVGNKIYNNPSHIKTQAFILELVSQHLSIMVINSISEIGSYKVKKNKDCKSIDK